MNKYKIVNGEWVVMKTAQTYDTPGFWENVGAYGAAGTAAGAAGGALFGGVGAAPGAILGGGIGLGAGAVGGAISWLAGDGTALKEKSLKDATEIMLYVYGEPPYAGWGPFIEALENSKGTIGYLDADYTKNIDAIKEDFDEVRQKNIDTLSAMQKASNNGAMFGGMPAMGSGSKGGKPGVAKTTKGKRGPVQGLKLD